MIASFLPFQQDLAAYPFTGVTLNIDVSTLAHLDPMDFKFCVVIPFGHWTGGELSLAQLGLVLELQAGDVIFFPSAKIIHFNQSFTGERGSFVLTTDKHLETWVDDFNGWGKNIQ
jgi:hypothetical protein